MSAGIIALNPCRGTNFTYAFVSYCPPADQKTVCPWASPAAKDSRRTSPSSGGRGLAGAWVGRSRWRSSISCFVFPKHYCFRLPALALRSKDSRHGRSSIVHKLNKKFDLTHVVKDVTCQIHDKDSWFFVGHVWAAARPRTMRMIAASRSHHSGDILIDKTTVASTGRPPPMDRTFALGLFRTTRSIRH